MEVYANGRECVTIPVSASATDNLTFNLFARGGGTRATSIAVWQLKSGKGGKPSRD
jgi:hypothetical protein